VEGEDPSAAGRQQYSCAASFRGHGGQAFSLPFSLLEAIALTVLCCPQKKLPERITQASAAAARDREWVESSALPRSMTCIIYHGVGACILQLPASVCSKQKEPKPMPDSGAGSSSGVFLVEESLEDLVMESNWVPAFCFCGLARSSSSSKIYKDGEAGGYSIIGCVVSKPLCIVTPPRGDDEDEDSERFLLDPMNLRALLHPLQIDTKACKVGTAFLFGIKPQAVFCLLNFLEQVEWKEEGVGKGNAAKKFAKGDFTFPGFKLSYASVMKGADASAASLKGIYLRDAWISFGEGIPEDNSHTIPYRQDALDSGSLPPYKLQLVMMIGCVFCVLRCFILITLNLQVRDLLKRAGKVVVGSYVGKYVLYSGKQGGGVPTARSSSRRVWMEGIILSQRGDDDATMMVEVLYLNGWVLWHARKSLETEPKRTSR